VSDSASEKFWQDRFSLHGHTGWADPRIYEFDQQCRLSVFSQWLDDQAFSGKLALDFGAGTGDFARLLIDKGWQVVSYDKYIRPIFQHRKLQTASSAEVVAASAPYDLIVSITVLDHIMDEAEFRQQVVDFKNWLKSDGMFFLLEYSSPTAQPPSLYQAFRTMKTWEDALAGAKLRLEVVKPFFHPDEAPVPAWASYRASLIVRACGRLCPLRVPMALIRPLLAQATKMALRRHSYSAPASSPVHILSGTAQNSGRRPLASRAP
jgi:2-polyprenyl-3-methyl-5-hydroxy-6-metoxy-1,4-benzoquinol methylase